MAASVYVGIGLITVEESTHQHDPANKLLERTRTEIKRVEPGKIVGLGGNGPYAGCRVLLLEHLFLDCFSLRTGEEDSLPPETYQTERGSVVTKRKQKEIHRFILSGGK